MSEESSQEPLLQPQEPPEGEQTTGEGATEDSPPQPEDSSAEQPQKPKGVQKRIDELTANWREEQRRNQELTQQNFELQRRMTDAPKEPTPEPTPQQPTAEPRLDDYRTYEEYVGALAEFKADRRFEALQAQNQQETAQQTRERERAEFMAKAAEYSSEVSDYNTVAYNPNLPVTDTMADVMNVAENGPQMLYFLGQNPAEALRLSQLPPTRAAMEMGRLSATLGQTAPPTPTGAPAPVTPIEGSSGGNTNVDPEKMSVDEWKAWRNKQLKR